MKMLCRRSDINNIHTKQKKDSLQINKILPPPAQVDTPSGRVSSCTFFYQGSFTVEAAFIVPLFFFAMVILLNLTDMIRVQSSVTLSLNESAKQLGMYGYASEEIIGSSPVQSVETGACIAYAKARLPALERVLVSFSGSSYQNHIVDLRARVTYQFPVRFAGIWKVSFFCRARVHAWTGYRAEEDGNFTGSDEEMVYITERQTVYHTHSDCSHLQISILAVTRGEVSSRRNSNGEKYDPCPHCKPDGSDATLYITLHGDRYHSDPGCQALKRSGSMVPKSSVSHLKECSRCAGRG